VSAPAAPGTDPTGTDPTGTDPTGTDPTGTLLVIAKEPVPGRVKTRLQSRFSPQEAGALAAAALHDTLATVAATPVRHRVLVLDGDAGTWVPEGFLVVRQRGDGLDQRLAAAFDDCAALVEDPGPMLLVGMDTPQLTTDLLQPDWDGADALLGRTADGGYWCIGLRRPCAEALVGVPMSTPRTATAQLARLRGLGLRVRLLPELVDVDTPEDAERVAAAAPGTRFARVHDELTAGAGVHPMALFEDALGGATVSAAPVIAAPVSAAPVSAAPVSAARVGTQGAPGCAVLDTARWTGPPDEVDELVVSRCEAPVLDLGCGPGRLVTAAGERGLVALGVDVSRLAVDLTRRRGGSVLRRRVEDRLPAEGRWGTVLLADGNIGIGGDPAGMLARCRRLLRPGGLLLVEADADDAADDRDHLVLRAEDGRRSAPLPWARVGSPALARLLAENDFSVVEEWRAQGRVLPAARSLGPA